jgi:hypothetical protein
MNNQRKHWSHYALASSPDDARHREIETVFH